MFSSHHISIDFVQPLTITTLTMLRACAGKDARAPAEPDDNEPAATAEVVSSRGGEGGANSSLAASSLASLSLRWAILHNSLASWCHLPWQSTS